MVIVIDGSSNKRNTEIKEIFGILYEFQTSKERNLISKPDIKNKQLNSLKCTLLKLLTRRRINMETNPQT